MMLNKKILSLIKQASLEDLDILLLEINKERDDVYVEWINSNDYSEKIIKKCKNYEQNILDIDSVIENTNYGD